MSNDSNKGYKFNIANGAVTAVYEVKNGRIKFEKMERDEVWSVDGGNVIKTEYEHGRAETTIYSDIDGDGIFAKMSKSYGTDSSSIAGSLTTQSSNSNQLQNGYQFDVVNGAVVAVYEIERGYKSKERIDLNETWTIDGANIIKTEVERGITETSIYSDLDGDGVFAKVSKSYVATDGSVWNSNAPGNDDLYGGLGKDTFKITNVFESGLTSNTRDHIFDFTNGDKIDLSAIDAKVGNWTNDAFTFIGNSSNLSIANANGAVWFENGVLYGSNDRDTAAEFQIELVGVTLISQTDIVL